MLFLEESSLLQLESALFAIGPYFTQGAAWGMIGEGQFGLTDMDITIHHRLQCFNEQVGDALKELNEHLWQVWRAEEGKKAYDKMNEKRKALSELPPSHDPNFSEPDYDTAYNEYQEALQEYAEEKEKIKEESGIGFYRSSQYEGRMFLELREMTLWLEGKKLIPEGEEEKEEALPEAEQLIQNRIKDYHRLYPETTSPDETNIEALKLECEVAKTLEKLMSKLKAIREGLVWKGAKYEEEDINYGAAEYTADRKIEESKTLVNETLEDGGEFDTLLKDPKRQDAKIDYDETGSGGSRSKHAFPLLQGKESHARRLRDLSDHLLWHAAVVNRNLRPILSRGPMTITVKNLAAKE